MRFELNRLMENPALPGVRRHNVPDRATFRNRVLEFERALSAVPGAVFGNNDLCPLKHTYVNGMYVREMFIPAGTIIVGKIHRHANPVFLLQGEITVLTESDGKMRMNGPCYMISQAGTKRIGYAHTDVKWVTIHRTDTTNPDKSEDELIAATYEEFERGLL